MPATAVGRVRVGAGRSFADMIVEVNASSPQQRTFPPRVRAQVRSRAAAICTIGSPVFEEPRSSDPDREHAKSENGTATIRSG
jgi:hypothetical protein